MSCTNTHPSSTPKSISPSSSVASSAATLVPVSGVPSSSPRRKVQQVRNGWPSEAARPGGKKQQQQACASNDSSSASRDTTQRSINKFDGNKDPRGIPVVKMTNQIRGSPVYMPMDVLHINANQRYNTRLSDSPTAAATVKLNVTKAASAPSGAVQYGVRLLNWANDPYSSTMAGGGAGGWTCRPWWCRHLRCLRREGRRR
ncbi:hypothetical protein BU25DRAFT_423195 [Macroventuria anomochaeta]|uniref:Uncharacterized protein n=1 Tax=Macroventuria anomochaeta TaxID=301207 RepID=A0ACB6RUU9_9PLEO|nr:uncharacterized protein BU25DRAFT_423195 [Macroventuria anomochaeta]KAF2625487.1 hypothetical protein BU25DRAFT_423195 [Macroventuria anomochaeta]